MYMILKFLIDNAQIAGLGFDFLISCYCIKVMDRSILKTLIYTNLIKFHLP